MASAPRPRILLVSKPLGPPWNDSSKNLVRDLALGLARHEARGFGRRTGPERLGNVELEPLYPAKQDGFSPALRDNARVLFRLVGGRGADLFHFFFAPKVGSVARVSAAPPPADVAASPRAPRNTTMVRKRTRSARILR